MATEIKTWQIVEGTLTQINSSLIESQRREREHLESWIKSNPIILGEDIAIIGEQVQTKSGSLDFLGIDNNGNIIIVELKRDSLPREALVQAMDYASDIANWEVDRFNDICLSYTNQNLEDFLIEKFPNKTTEDLSITQAQRILLVGFSIEEPLSRIVEWLSSKYNVGINAIVLNYVKTSSGDELLSRTVIIPEEVEREKTNRKKFIIEMSTEPGTYDNEVLKEQLVKYLSNNLYSSQRIRDYFLPTLLKKGIAKRDQMKKEFVKLGAAEDESQAGYFLALISNQLGHKRKDYLRQVINFEPNPNAPWEKDNFKINDDYIDLVKEVLDELKVKRSES
jgi:hypothetical protein